jgi:hypothetical protein
MDVKGDDARENLRVSLELVEGGSAPVLIDLRPIRSQTSEARAVFAGTDATVFTKACALVIANPLSRVRGIAFAERLSGRLLEKPIAFDELQQTIDGVIALTRASEQR